MKFLIEKAAFAAALARLARIVERRNTYPILANCLLSASEGRLALRATDLDIEVTESIAATVSEPGTTTLPAHTLSDIVRKFPDGAEISVEEKDSVAIVKAGRSRFSLACLDPTSFPDLKVGGEFTHTFDIAASALKRIIEKTQFAISKEETRYYLNGIFFHCTTSDKGEDVLRGVATDGHRLAYTECEAPAGAVGMPGIILPKKSVGEIHKLIAAHDGSISVEVSDTKIRFTIGEVVLLSKLIEGTFPDYGRVTPKLTNTIAELDISSLRSALDRVSTVSTDRGGKSVKFSLSEGKLELIVSNPDHGDSTEDMDAGWSGDPFDIGFNVRYAMDVLGVLDGKTAHVSMSDPGAPSRIFSPDDPGTVLVLMPMMV